MSAICFHAALLRFCSAHCPVSLTALGTAQACPVCLASPFNQLTGDGDDRPDRPIERAVRCASVPSQIGGFTLSRSAGVLTRERNLVSDALNHGHCSGRRAHRFLGPSALAAAVIQCSIPELSGSLRPFFPSSLFPKRRLRAKRKDGFTLRPSGRKSHSRFVCFGEFNSSPAFGPASFFDLFSISPRTDVMEQSDFPGGNHRRHFCCAKMFRSPRVRHASNQRNCPTKLKILNLIK